jgi:Arc/MetJ-type ribon-helix-helix transcriptional regulator
MPDRRVTIKIPRTIYDRIQALIAESGFSSPTEFIVYVLRDLISEIKETGGGAGDSIRDELTRQEVQAIRRRLTNLGYLSGPLQEQAGRQAGEDTG